MNIVKGLLFSLAVAFWSSWPAGSDDASEIAVVVQKYFDGTANGRPGLVAEAFLPSLELQFVGKDGELRRWKGTDYIANIKEGVQNKRMGRLVAIDVTGAAATAKAEIISGDRTYTDYFLLLKLKDGWRIANKTFVRH
ncbi:MULTISPECIES: nuclear transport factor 2 family protein [Kordiimonas]|jgi:hypothetical protein|uniref:nuclear transport factor 2 family protein n=1 Tax=Kordiimonas TaxID=288021 RepID=UPI00257FE5AE|nr:nuclear transport factor 2 family protein [Kordiimonas sp. UBA4487]